MPLDKITKAMRQQAVGFGGTEIVSGFDQKDYKSEWNDTRRAETVEEMNKQDGFVYAAINSWKLLFASKNYFLTNGLQQDNPKHEKAEELKKQLETTILAEMKSRLMSAASMVEYGFSVFGVDWDVNSSGFVYPKLSPRVQKTINKWKWSNNMLVVEQFGYNRNLQKFETTDIPEYYEDGRRQLVVFTYNAESDEDYTGTPALRAMWKHWATNEKYTKMSAVIFEKQGMGALVIYLPETANESDRSKADEIGRNWRVNEKGHIVIPGSKNQDNGWFMEWITPNGSGSLPIDVHKMIEHGNLAIMLTVGAQYLLIGTQSMGGNAQGGDQRMHQMQLVDASSNTFADKIEKCLIKPTLELNTDDQEIIDAIRLKSTPLIKRNGTELVTLYKELVASGVIKPTKKDEDFIRAFNELPEITEEDRELLEEQQALVKKAMAKQTIKKEVVKVEEEDEDEPEEEERAASNKEVKVSQREKEYERICSDHEKTIRKDYKSFINEVDKAEDVLISKIKTSYNQAKTEQREGGLYLAKQGNAELMNKIKQMVEYTYGVYLFNKYASDSYADKIIERSKKMAYQAINKLEQHERQAVSKAEYLSNIKGVFGNTSRQIQEQITRDFGYGAGVVLAIKNITDKIGGRANFEASYLTYPRAEFRRVVFLESQDSGYSHYKTIIPLYLLSSLKEGSETAKHLYAIKSYDEWATYRDDTNSSPAMGIHINDWIYYLPIASATISEEEQISKMQRKQL